MLVLRALLGIGEAAFGPGLPYYLSFFFRREELAYRTGLFISAAPLASSFAGSLAWLIAKLGQRGPVAPWRILFLVEGFPSLIAGVIAWVFVPDTPATAAFLTRRERNIAHIRLREVDIDHGQKIFGSSHNGRPILREALETLLDGKCYLTALMFFACNVAFASLPVFLPSIIRDMGYSSVSSQALTAPIPSGICGGLVHGAPLRSLAEESTLHNNSCTSNLRGLFSGCHWRSSRLASNRPVSQYLSRSLRTILYDYDYNHMDIKQPEQ